MMADGKTSLVRKSFLESVKKKLSTKETTTAKMRKAKKAKGKSNSKSKLTKSKKQVASEADTITKKSE